MSKSTKVPRNKLYSRLGTKIVVGLLGLVLGIILHELFHILMHWDYVSHISLLPENSEAIVEVHTWLPQGYDLEGEEMIAYLITLLVWMGTILLISKIHVDADERSAGQILFPKDKEMQKLNPTEMLDLAERADPGQIVFTSKRHKKPRR